VLVGWIIFGVDLAIDKKIPRVRGEERTCFRALGLRRHYRLSVIAEGIKNIVVLFSSVCDQRETYMMF
jgi:hypothetical protein